MQAIITGASKGMGKHFAIELAARGYDLILVARSLKLLNELKTKLEKTYNVKVENIQADLSDVKTSSALAKKLVNKNIDILFNNAGFGILKPFHEIDEGALNAMTNLNLVTLQLWNHIFIKKMIKNDQGIIVNISSVAANIPYFPGNAPYAANKQYVRSLSKSIQLELKNLKSKVRVVTVQPGQIKTNWAKTASDNKFNDQGTAADKFAKKVIKDILDKSKDDVWAGKNSRTIKIASKLLSKKALGKITNKALAKSYK